MHSEIKQKKSKMNSIHNIIEGFSQVYCKYPLLVIFQVMFIATSLFPILDSRVFAWSIDIITYNSDIKKILLCVSIYFMAKFAINSLNTLSDWCLSVGRQSPDNHYKMEVMNKLEAFNTKCFENNEWLYQIKRLNQISAALGDLFVAFTRIIGNVALIIGSSALIFSFVGKYAILIYVIIITPILESFLINKYKYRLIRSQNAMEQRTSMIQRMLFRADIIKEIKVYHCGSYIIKTILGRKKEVFHQQMKMEVEFGVLSLVDKLITSVLLCVLLISAYKQLIIERVTVGDFLSIITLLMTLVAKLERFASDFSSFWYSVLEWNEINGFLKENSANEVPTSIVNANDKIEYSVNNLCYSYPGSNRFVINNASFVIKKGEKIALVGVNGAGKSTLMHLLAGIYQQDSGKVQMNKVDTNLIAKDTIQKLIAYVFQSPIRYPLTIDDNITLFEQTERTKDICNRISLDIDEIRNKGGILRKGFTNSNDLSGGQWQKVAIARALLKREAEIFFFDEPTAALDPISEVNIFKRFQELVKDKTVIISTHRLGIARDVDKIIFLDDGKVIDIGTHEELMIRCAKYREMYEAQADWYGDYIEAKLS